MTVVEKLLLRYKALVNSFLVSIILVGYKASECLLNIWIWGKQKNKFKSWFIWIFNPNDEGRNFYKYKQTILKSKAYGLGYNTHLSPIM